MSKVARTFIPGPKLSESFVIRFRAITNFFSLYRGTSLTRNRAPL